MEFQVGEKVIYPNHGIGVVESIQTRPIPGGKISLYQLRILANDSRVWVPQQNADGVGLRPVIRTAEVRKIFILLGDGKIDQLANWKGRFKENSDKMRTGSLFEVAVVLKGLTYLSRKKALSFREKRMLERAKFLLDQRDRRGGGQDRARPSRSGWTRPSRRPSASSARSRRRGRWAAAGASPTPDLGPSPVSLAVSLTSGDSPARIRRSCATPTGRGSERSSGDMVEPSRTAMTKADLISVVAKRLDITQVQAGIIVEAALRSIVVGAPGRAGGGDPGLRLLPLPQPRPAQGPQPQDGREGGRSAEEDPVLQDGEGVEGPPQQRGGGRRGAGARPSEGQ